MNSIPQKTCTKCGQTFLATTEFFHKRTKGKHGVSAQCKECRNFQVRQYKDENKEYISQQKHQYYLNNKDYILEQTRNYYNNNKDKRRIWARKYNRKNRARLYLAQKKRMQSNRGQYAEYSRRWRKRHPEKVAIGNNNRRARQRNLPDTFTPEQWVACLEYFNYTCAVCGSQLRDLFGNVEPHADHWIPLSYEGDDNPGTVATNMICLCNSCNLSKGAKLPDVWLKEQFGTRKANKIMKLTQVYFGQLIG